MTLPAYKEKKYTYEDYLNITDDNRYEIIEGVLIMVPAPVPYHQIVSQRIGFELIKFIKENKIGELFHAPCDVVFNNTNVVQPDIMVILNKNLQIIKEKNISGPPDIAIEILSESTAHKDLIKKRRLYEKFQVKEYWVVDPMEKLIAIYSLKNERFEEIKTYSKKEKLTSPILKGFSLQLSDIFKEIGAH